MRALVVALALGAVAVAPAAAQPGKPSKADIAEAKKRFQAAEAARAKGDWDTAATEYLAAYAKFPDPEFYFNVGEVYRRKGDDEKALEYFQKYLALDSTGRGAPAARTAVAELTKAIEARKAAEAEQKRKLDAELEAAAATRGPPNAPPPPPPQDVVEAPPRPGRGLRIAGIATGGAGLAGVGLGVYFGLRARKIDREASDWVVFDPDRYAQGERAARNMIIAVSVGGAAIVTGGVLYYLGYRRGRVEERPVAITPIAPSGGAGLAIGGQF